MLNQRSVVLRISSLPTPRTSTEGTMVRPSSAATSLRRNRENGSPRRRSTTSFTRLRASTNASASSIVASAIDSAYSTTSVRKSGLSCVERSASVIMAIRLTSRRMMPARIRRGLSRNGRRSTGGGPSGSRRGGSVGLGVKSRTAVTKAGIRSPERGIRRCSRFRPSGTYGWRIPDSACRFLGNEREPRHAGDVMAVPGQEEPEGGARARARADAQVVLGVRLEARRREERQAIEGRQPPADDFLAVGGVGALDAAVVGAGHVVLAGERVVLDRRRDRRRRDGAVEPDRGAPFEIDVVQERQRQAGVN